jgi:hypothetical protein
MIEKLIAGNGNPPTEVRFLCNMLTRSRSEREAVNSQLWSFKLQASSIKFNLSRRSVYCTQRSSHNVYLTASSKIHMVSNFTDATLNAAFISIASTQGQLNCLSTLVTNWHWGLSFNNFSQGGIKRCARTLGAKFN